ncbi:unnamed protein product [Chilo suppressalis]|uniref:Spaetzle domain-containing protein n=1 Tax=Chilo suppressalis TaxID=168631 RepID=A0ABN8AXA7_CHISP|nr:unnamed protein product [Chilo suppressalis]
MSARLILAIAAAAALAACVAAMPRDYRDPITLDLNTVLNKTVCPINVTIDSDMDRIPKHIKVMKCQRDPNVWCAKMHIPKYECCQHQRDNVKLQCVEIQDTVQVYYPATGSTQLYRVSVGCACVMEEAATLMEPTPGGR